MKSDWMAGRVAVYLAVDMVLALAVPARARGVSKEQSGYDPVGRALPHNGLLCCLLAPMSRAHDQIGLLW
jgi:hypothetical protein